MRTVDVWFRQALLRVSGKPSELPEFLARRCTKLELGKTIRVADIDLEGIKILSPDSTGIAMVDIPRALRTGDGEEGEEGEEEEEAVAEEEA